MQLIEVNGQEFEFPDDMADDQIKAVLDKEFKPQAKAAPVTYDPTEGMSAADKFFAGVGKSMHDTYRGTKQLFGAASPEELTEWKQIDAPLMDTGWGMGGNILGHMAQFVMPGGVLGATGKAATALGKTKNASGLLTAGNALTNTGKAFIAPTSVKAAAGAGASYGLLQPGDKAQNVALGGGGGALGQAVTKGITSTIAPKIKDSVRGLLDKGVDLTPGQILGGTAKTVEDASTSVPIIGDFIINAQKRSNDSLNKAVWNKVLKPLGKKMPDDIPMGHDAYAHVDKVLKESYSELLPKMKGKVDAEFIKEITNLKSLVGADTLPDELAKTFDKIISKEVMGKFTDSGLATGETLKKIQSRLGSKAKNFRKSTDAHQRDLGDAILEAKFTVDRLISRSNPKYADKLKAIDEGYAMKKTAQRAASGLGTDDGVFTAAQINNAVKTSDNSLDKNLFAKGEGLLQDISRPAKSIMPSKIPDSGTAFRLANMATGGAALGGGLLHPAIPAALAGASGLYSKAGVNMMNKALTQRPQFAGALANQLENMTPLMKAGGVTGLLSLQ